MAPSKNLSRKPSPRVALVTGGGKRIGQAIALELGRAGFDVIVHYNASRAEAEATAVKIRSMGRRAATAKADLADPVATAKLIGRAGKLLGPLTALVNNASLFEKDDIATFSSKSWERHMDVNLRAPLILARDFARQLPQGAQGAIVNLLDQRLFKPTPQFLSYGVSKAGLQWLTVTLAQELAPHIRVNAVAPGPTLRNARQSETHFREQQASTILGSGPTPEDVAAATRYLLEARTVTGQTIAVDGGQHLIWRTADVRNE